MKKNETEIGFLLVAILFTVGITAAFVPSMNLSLLVWIAPFLEFIGG